MNILFCIDRYHPSRGGAERYLKDLSAALHARGHSIKVAALDAEEDGIVERIIISAPPFPRWMRELVFAIRACKLREREDIDKVLGFRHIPRADLFQPHEGLFIDSLLGSLRPLSANPVLRWLVFFKKLLSLKNLFFLYADWTLLRQRSGLKIAALSRMTADSIRGRYGRRDLKITVIPNGVDTTRFHPELRETLGAGVRKKLDLSEEHRVILFVGHNFKLKGLREAINGVAEYQNRGGNPVLWVVGRGKQQYYRKLSRDLGIEKRIVFWGESHEMESLYAAAHVLLHPTFYDPCSLVVLEAMGSGIPVLTTGYNGAAELVKEGSAGWVVKDPRDKHTLALALEDILHKDHYSAFRENASKLGRLNSFSHHVDRMEQWILEEG